MAKVSLCNRRWTRRWARYRRTELAAQGAGVTVTEINEATGQSTADELRKAGFEAEFARVDIRSEDDISAGIAAHVAQFGGLNILVNNAGANQNFDASQMSVDEWEQSMSLNLRGAWLCCKHALPIMAARESGVIINIASVHATTDACHGNFPVQCRKVRHPRPDTQYSARLGAIRIFARLPLALDYIRTQPVIDGFAKAFDPDAEERRVIDLHPLKRIGEPENVGKLVAFLASDDACYITGTEIVIDGGISARYAD